MKIISYEAKFDGITLRFSEPISLNGGVSTDEWYLSWDKLSDLILRGSHREPPTARAIVYSAIDGERAYQDERPLSVGDGKTKSVGEHIVLLQHYQHKAVEAWTDNQGDREALEVIRKVAAIAVRCMEEHGAPMRQVKG